MRAAIYSKKGPAVEVLQITERPMPEPATGEVRVRMAFSGVNPSDVKSRAGVASKASSYAEVIPHSDGAGVIDAAGDDVSKDLIGRRVWTFNAQWERPYGTAAEYVTLPAQQVVPLPDDVSMEVGASIGIPLMTAFHAVAACGSVLGRTVLVFGSGGSVGYYATQLAKLAGARVIGVVSNDTKAELARNAGADEVVNYRQEDVSARVRELTSGHGADFIIEVDAAGNATNYGNLLAFGGKVVIYGSGAPQINVPFGPMIISFATLYFFIVYRLPSEVMRQTTEGVTDLLKRSVLRHPSVAIYDLEDIVDAHERVEQGANAKVLIRL
jgi:NADPH2:quinone reductase